MRSEEIDALSVVLSEPVRSAVIVIAADQVFNPLVISYVAKIETTLDNLGVGDVARIVAKPEQIGEILEVITRETGVEPDSLPFVIVKEGEKYVKVDGVRIA